MKHFLLFFNCFDLILLLLCNSFLILPVNGRLFDDQDKLFQHPKFLDYDPTDSNLIRNELIVVFENDDDNDNQGEVNNNNIDYNQQQQQQHFDKNLLQTYDNNNNNIRTILHSILGKNNGSEIIKIYKNVFHGAVIRGLPQDRLRFLLDNNQVKYVSMNSKVSKNTDEINAVWGLDRIDQYNNQLNGMYSYAFNGTGVTAFVMDTGIRLSHNEFSGRASCGYDAFPKEGTQPCDDLDGHGTHVAGTIGGRTYGVAKNVNLVSVKVLNSRGEASWLEILGGFEFIIAQRKKLKTPMVLNLSLGGRRSIAINEALNRVIRTGVVVTVASGNESRNACLTSPASSVMAITVGATDDHDHIASFSNFGNCVDIFAPGTDIKSASRESDYASATMSGTSMACPHAAGVVALYLEQNPWRTPQQILIQLQTDATKNVITGLESTGIVAKINKLFGYLRPNHTPVSPSPNLLLNTNNL